MNRLILAKDIYAKYAVEKAIYDFSEVSQIDLFEDDFNFICVFNSLKYDTDVTIKEFENYVIDVSFQMVK